MLTRTFPLFIVLPPVLDSYVHYKGVSSLAVPTGDDVGGDILASGGRKGKVLGWDMRVGSGSNARPVREWEEEGRGEIVGMDFDHDGRWLAVANVEGTVTILDIRRWEALMTLEGGVTDGVGVRCTGLTVDEDSGVMASAMNDGTVRMWETRGGEVGGGDIVVDDGGGGNWRYWEEKVEVECECVIASSFTTKRNRTPSGQRGL